MRTVLFLGILVLCTGVLSCAPAQKRTAGESFASVASDDPEMTAAIAKARSTLPTFYEHWKHPGPGESDFNLKLKITDGNKVEHFWMADLKGTVGQLTGIVNDTPESVQTVKAGQRIPIPDDRITDWLYLHRGKIVGNWTVRALFKEMSPEEVKAMKDRLESP